ncbi:hypothetical protein PED38_11450 [Clavibacter sp. CT19]|uniref:hypothetical protein n=1 Tax=Clavibacter sp. CT19 TaxID=3018990 RepID=UPI0022EAE263|nr:hypothetical protein [Clavibacter sp. CT19]MDA3805413.1 hypothetical protein [Clavibacter sp. CT19]
MALVSLFTLPWLIATIALVSFYAYYRLESRRTPVGLPTTAWLKDGAVPDDVELRALWSEGRSVMRENGEPIDASLAPVARPKATPSRQLSEIHEDISERTKAIEDSSPRGDFHRVAQVLFASTVIYAAQLYATPVNFAPLERIASSTVSIDVGYVIESSNSYLIVDSTLTRGVHVGVDTRMTRSICTTSQFGESVVQLLDRRTEEEGVDCPPPEENADYRRGSLR